MVEHVTIKGLLWTAFFIWFFVYSVLGIGGRDDTDSKTSKSRSGLSLYTDYGTGLQYVKGGLFGGLQPRLDVDGKQMSIDVLK